jgi:hypothetical protein
MYSGPENRSFVFDHQNLGMIYYFVIDEERRERPERTESAVQLKK